MTLVEQWSSNWTHVERRAFCRLKMEHQYVDFHFGKSHVDNFYSTIAMFYLSIILCKICYDVKPTDWLSGIIWCYKCTSDMGRCFC